MIFVYLLIFYTLKTVYDAMEKEHFARSMKEQIALQKKQYEFYLEKMQSERIFRHDARHRDTILLGYFDRGDVSGAKKFLSDEMSRIFHSSDAVFCENVAVNSVLSQYSSKAENRKISFAVRADVPQNLSCDEAEFCVMLSNLLENSLDAKKNGISIEIRCHNRQISIKIENDYDGEIKIKSHFVKFLYKICRVGDFALVEFENAVVLLPAAVYHHNIRRQTVIKYSSCVS